MRPVGICSVPGCPEDAETNGKCSKCLAEVRQRTDRRRGGGRARGYDKKWARTRRRYLETNPVCEEHDCTEEATDVHHRDGLGPKGPRGHDPANLQALCHSHHSQVTALEQPGGFNAR